VTARAPSTPPFGEDAITVAEVERSDDDGLGGRVREAAPERRDVQAERWHGAVAARLFGRRAAPPTIGRYQVIARLGGGASGDVWSAIDPQLDRKVAVKLLHDSAALEDRRAAMVREAKSLAKLSHPNVVPVFDAGVHDGRVFVTLELVEGGTMRQWLATQRSWREIVDVFLQCARGLQAAHAAGIVHRDFKPENVLIGDDGRVRVSDFGIARELGSDEEGRLRDTITSSAGIGTPAYMAPEQFLGDPIDGRADQFGFFVALHEALCGERPFSGRDRMALAANVTAGRRRAPPAGVDAPGWLLGIVARGLATDPERRWPDMTAVIRALDHRPRPRAAAWLVGTAIGAAALGIAMQSATPPRACDDGRVRLGAVWSPSAAQAIRDAFVATALPHGNDRADRLVAELDRFADEWEDAHDEACTATIDDGIRIAQQYCLHTRLLELQSMVTAFTRADPSMVEHTSIGAVGLRAPSECLYVGSGNGASTDDPEQDLELRAAIANARTLGDIGKLADGLTAAHAATDRAVQVGNRSLEAEALLVTAELQNLMLGHTSGVDPRATMHAAVLAAEAAHRPDLVALALVATVESELARGDHAAARLVEPRARAAAGALGNPPELAGRIDLAASEMMLMGGEDADGVAALERARMSFERAGAGSRRWLAQAHNNTGELAFGRAEYDVAREHYQRALAIVTADLRSHHLIVANASGNLAETYFVVGDFATAETLFADALQIRREVFGSDSVWVTHTLGHLADIAWEQGDPQRALELYDAALAGGPARSETTNSADVVANVLRDLQARLQPAWMNNGAALALVDLGRHDDALARAELAADVGLADDAQHPDQTSRVDMRGQVLLAMGRADEAVAAFEDALVRLRAKYPERSRPIALATLGLGRAQLEAGSDSEAIATLQRGLAMFAATPRAYPRVQAAARFALGRAWLRDDSYAERGREQIRIAIALLADGRGTLARDREAMIAALER
jgi:tetratricopeptide (TPR) repeat protein